MKLFKFTPVLLTFAFSLASASANSMTFISTQNDICVACSLSENNNPGGQWVTEEDFSTLSGSTGAKWIQSDTAWDQIDVTYLILESDLNNSGTDLWISELYLSGDGNVEVKIGEQLIWSSWNIEDLWKNTVIDVIAELGTGFALGANESLDFYVINKDGPTGLIYSGTASEVPVPASAWLFSSALVGLMGLGRNK